MENEDNEIPEYISKLREIKKDELSEREFYEKVLEQIAKSGSLTPQMAKLLKQTLLEIGCKSYSEWEAEKISNGERFESITMGKALESADIRGAVSIVSYYLNDYESVKYSQEYIVGTDYIQTWLRNSKAINDKNISGEGKDKNELIKDILNKSVLLVRVNREIEMQGNKEKEAIDPDAVGDNLMNQGDENKQEHAKSDETDARNDFGE